MKRFIVLCAAMAAMVAASARAEILYNFNDGTNQGWTNIDLENPSTGQAWEWTVGTGASSVGSLDGDYIYPGITDWLASPYEQDAAHSTRIFRSPEFQLDGTGNIALYLNCGMGGTATVTTATLPAESSSSGFLGVALRDVTTGEYVAWTRKTSNSLAWEHCTMDLTGIDISDTYTLDLIDAFDGGFGWVAMDHVTIPGTAVPEPGTLALLAAGLVGLAACVWRKRK
jgi:hypothetical protein